MSFSVEALFRELRPVFHASRYIVALSGGMDSVVLLHALRQLPLSQPLMAIHINHQLSPNADSWQAHCEKLCKDWGIPLFVRKVNVVQQGAGLEEAARNARYDEFAEFLEPGDCLLSAHHLNDQAETFLLRLARGSGPRGLGAMPRTRQIGDGYIFRPFLDLPRHELAAYAAAEKLSWIEDESNQNEQFDRNFIRHTVLDPLKTRWPAILENISRSAQLSREAEELGRELAAIDLFACYARDDRWGYSISTTYLKGCSRVRQKNAIRFWIEQKGIQMPGQARLEEIVDAVLHASDDANPVVCWDHVQCRRFDNRLYLINVPSAFHPEPVYELGTGDILTIKGMGEVSLSSDIGMGLRLKRNDRLQVKFREGGERCKPATRAHSQTLKKLLQEYRVPPWVRDRTPLIHVNNELAAVGDFWINEGFSVRDEKETGFVVGCLFDLS